MKKLRIYIPVLVLGLLLGSCKKYLDVKNNSIDKNVETAEDCQMLLDYYSVMNTGYPSDGELSADDYFMQPANYTNLTDPVDRDLFIWSPNARRESADPQWQNPYKVVLQSNLVLETVEKIRKGSSDAAKLDALKGAALFYRAYAFWNVAQLYAKPYTAATATQDPGIPLRTTSDLNDKFERGTVQQTYDKIVQDLKEAANLLPVTSSIATRPNKVAAYAMLARTWLSMENYADALTASNSALTLNSQLLDYNSISAGSNNPFSPRFNKEVIFHSTINPGKTLVPNLTTARMDPDLVASYDANDLRKAIFYKLIASDGTYRFTGSYEGGFLNSEFFNGLAVDELYLVRAECYARANKPTQAMADLNTLMVTRWKKISGVSTFIDMTATNADDALDKILKERRKELVMRAQRWTDLRRLNKDTRYAKELNRIKEINGVIYKLPPNDLRYVLLIPDQVINTGGMVQNAR